MPGLIEIGLLVLEKKIFKSFQCIFALLLLSPLGQKRSPSFENLESPPLRMIYANSGQNWPSGSGEEFENVKVYRQTDGQQAIRKAHLSFQLR
jgi:hypothetical protein